MTPTWLDKELFPYESRFLDVDAHRIHYADEGTGPVLLFIHGAPTWCLMYREMIERLRGRFRCIAIDCPVFGLSEAGPGFGFRLRDHVEVIGAFVHALALRDVLVRDKEFLAATEAGIRAHLAARPTLLMYGEHDAARKVGFQTYAEGLFTNHRSLVIAGEQHYPPLAACPELADEIHAWWDDVERG